MLHSGPVLRLEQARCRVLRPRAAARTDFESCHLGSRTFGKFPFGKIPLESCCPGNASVNFPMYTSFITVGQIYKKYRNNFQILL